jgi:hypothetical protein
VTKSTDDELLAGKQPEQVSTAQIKAGTTITLVIGEDPYSIPTTCQRFAYEGLKEYARVCSQMIRGETDED